MSHDRNLEFLNRRRIVYHRNPITDKPDQENECYMFYIEGTYECYELFRSKAKINTYRSLKWHLLVLWYLNPQLDQDKFMEIAEVIGNKDHGFISFNIHVNLLRKIVYEVSMCDLEEPPKNKLRKVIFKPTIMRRLIYDMYYAYEISIEIAERLLDKLNEYLDKKRY